MADQPTPAVIGIDIGGTKTLGVVVDGDARVVADMKWPTPETTPALMDMLEALSGELQAAVGDAVAVRAVGIGVAGLVDPSGRLRRAPNLVNADESPIRDMLEPRIGLPVVVDNDANCAARAELAVGVAMGITNAVLITLGTGIGGAVIIDGLVHRGNAGMAGEPGHMLVDPAGPACPCGLRGCWERYASGAGLAHLGRLAAEAGSLDAVIADLDGDPERLRGEHLTRAARLGDQQAIAVLDTFAWWVAVGMANCAALLDPELIIVGGGLVRDWDLYGSRVAEFLGDLLLASDHRPAVPIEPAQAGEGASALGAALLAAGASGLRPPPLS